MAIFFLLACGRQSGDGDRNTEASSMGPELFARYGCATCHSIDGSQMYGPALNGIYLKQETVLRGGKTLDLTLDRKYIRRAIEDPGYEKVLGFKERTMPEPIISEEDMDILVEYIISL